MNDEPAMVTVHAGTIPELPANADALAHRMAGGRPYHAEPAGPARANTGHRGDGTPVLLDVEQDWNVWVEVGDRDPRRGGGML